MKDNGSRQDIHMEEARQLLSVSADSKSINSPIQNVETMLQLNACTDYNNRRRESSASIPETFTPTGITALDRKPYTHGRYSIWESRYLGKDHRRAGATFQGSVYNFLERPSGWKCLVYHSTVPTPPRYSICSNSRRMPRFREPHHRRVPTPMKRKRPSSSNHDQHFHHLCRHFNDSLTRSSDAEDEPNAKSSTPICIPDPYYPIYLPIDQEFKAKYIFHQRKGKTFKERVYVFLEHPCGWLCIIYHFTVGQVSLCFGKAFQRPSSAMTSIEFTNNENFGGKSNNPYIFEVSLEVKEDDGKGYFVNVPRDRRALKLRTNIEKQIYLSIQQILSKDQEELEIERCFGVLVSRGWNVKHSDMQLLDMISLGIKGDEEDSQKTYIVTGKWDVKEPAFESLNSELVRLPLTIAVDLVIKKIKEPVRLVIETQIKMYPQNERFWSFSRAQIYHQFYINLKSVPCSNGSVEPGYEVTNIERSPELDKSILNQKWNNFTNLIKSSSTTSIEGLSPKEEYSDTDEPMISGSGEVPRECPDRELELWNELLTKWTDTKAKPKQLNSLVRQGIPEAYRGEVWQRLTISEKDEELLNSYRILISKDCSAESVIQKDIHRTFPAHDYFKETGGVGQDTLFNIAKAYAVYDTEIGYCQGLTFIAASLLLHMPEEQSFCVLVRLMYDYKLRNLYKDGFENLNMKLYQLNRLLEEKDPQLWQHFKEMGVETHMFASHWFLTLYTARFPLYFVFFILDVVLVQGLDTIFQIALALLQLCKKDLLALDFENILKYFQVTLPKKCRNQWIVRKIISRACNIKLKKLKKYEREFLTIKSAQESTEQYNDELERLQNKVAKLEDDKCIMKTELSHVKESLFLEMQKSEIESKRNASIIADYKQICQRLDEEQTATKALLTAIRAKILLCEECSCALNELSSLENGVYVSNKLNNRKDEDVNSSNKIKELEVELAQTKLALVEAECRNQDLTHQLYSTSAELQIIRNAYPPWLHKTISSIKEVTANKKAVNTQNVANKILSLTKQETTSILN